MSEAERTTGQANAAIEPLRERPREQVLQALRLAGEMFGEVGIGMALASSDGVVSWLNPVLQEALGVPFQPGELCRDVLCGGTCERCPLEAATAERRAARSIRVLGDPERAPRFFHLVCLPIRTGGSAPSDVGVFALEFTEQEMLSRRARAQEQYILNIANNAAEAILILDRDSRILMWSRGAEAMFGYGAAELLGRPYAVLVPPDRLEAGELEEIAALVREKGHLRDYETVRVAKDGRRVPVQVSVTSVRNAAGAEEGRAVVIQDISARKREYLRQHLAVSRLALLNEIGNYVHGTVDPDEVLDLILVGVTADQGLRFNRAFLLLVDEEASALRGEVAIGPSDAAEAGRIWGDLARDRLDLKGALKSYRGSLRSADHPLGRLVRGLSVPLDRADHPLVRVLGQRRGLRSGPDSAEGPVPADLAAALGVQSFAAAPLLAQDKALGVLLADNAITGAPITDEDVELLRLFAGHAGTALENSRLVSELSERMDELAHAHSDLRANQEKLLELERLSVVGEMAAKVAHEIRTPLVSIGGFARQISRGLPEGDANHEALSIITDEVIRLERIVREILEFVRPPFREFRLGNLNEVIEEAARRTAAELAAENVVVRTHPAPDLPPVRLNRDQVLQVLLNLVHNAAQAMAEGGVVDLSTEAVPGKVRVHVDDAGVGIPEGMEGKIYRPFFSTKASGSGLGLAIAAQIAEQHQGSLTHQARAEGGTRFTLELPEAQERGGKGT